MCLKGKCIKNIKHGVFVVDVVVKLPRLCHEKTKYFPK